MDPERSRIQADLSGVLDGDIRCDDNFLQLYSNDASIYEVKPLGVVRPTGVEDVVACVNYARENDISLIPRGAGSSVSGGVVGDGLVLDFSYAMRSVKSLGRDEVTVEPGLVLRRLNQQLIPHRQHFGPDPATRSVTTMGGVLSNNSTGSRWNQYGSPRDRVSRLQVVLASGEVVELNSASHSTAIDTTQTRDLSDQNGQATADRLSHRVNQIVERNADLISRNRPQTRINQAGYNLFDLQSGIGGQAIDLTRLIVGSEGTLGIITEATLRTEALPTHRGVGLLFFERVADAAEAALEIDSMQPAACDMVDRRLLSIARQKDTRYQKILPVEAESMLLVEFQTADEKTLNDKLETLVSVIQRRKNLAFDVRTTSDPAERDFFWHLVRRVVPIQYRLGGQRRAIPFVEDIAIAPAMLPDFLSDLYGILNRHKVTASVFAHMPQGHLHVRPLINMADPGELPKMQRLASELFDRVIQAKGTISGGQGDGLSRTWYLRKQYGRLFSVFAEVKNVFDPQNILNPGKVIDHPPHGLTDDVREVTVAASLRVSGTDTNVPDDSTSNAANEDRATTKKKRKSAALPVVEPQLAWELADIASAAQACNGCARCRTQSANERMCPMFRAIPKEEASPRAKANLIRGVVTGQLDPRSISSEAFRDIADLCINCHQCRLDCPASVDIPKLMVEAKAQHFSVNGFRFSDWCLARLDWLYGLAGRMPRITNALLQNRVARWLLDRLLGIAEGRKLPPFAISSFSRWAHRKKLDRPCKGDGTKVIYFVDAYANWNDVELAQAFVAVLQKNNIEVFVPPEQMVSGMSLISDGVIGRARNIAQRNVESLAEWIHQGYRVVTTEPSAALALSHEYLGLLDDEDAKLVADRTIDATNFLMELHREGKLSTEFSPIDATIGYHLPCHQRALGPEVPAVQLLNLIPKLNVQVIDQGCSGMAGTFGLKRKNYIASLRMGFSLIDAMREPSLMAGATECSTCKIQMEQGTKTPTVHPVKFLALSYGLMPELEDLFDRRSEDLVTT